MKGPCQPQIDGVHGLRPVEAQVGNAAFAPAAQRNRIERMFGHLKINRAIATRYDQLANSFLGMVHLATARYWLKFVHAA